MLCYNYDNNYNGIVVLCLKDSGSSILGSGIRENTIPEALYSTVQETSPSSITGLNGGSVTISNQANTVNRTSQVVYAIPSMTSPPPTYDVAIAKTCQVCTFPTQPTIC